MAAPHGGTGKSTGKLVGHDKFVRHNPRSDRFAVLDFDHLEFWCADATNTARRFSAAFGLQIVASTNIDNGNFKYTSYVCQSGTVRFVFTAPYWTDAPPSKVPFQDPFPDFNREDALQFIAKHGMAGKAIGIQVDDATQAFEQCIANGGVAVTRPTRIADEHGEMVYSEVVYYNDVRLRWIQGRKTYKGAFIPGYKTEQRPAFTYGLKRIDHIVSNVPCITDITEHLNKMLGFHEFSEFTAEDVGTVDSGLNSMVMANNDETVLLPINEPTFGTRRKSQIQSFLEHHCGSGIQHIAISTDDVIASIEKMVEAGIGGGVEFMPNPGEAYYRDHVPAKMGNMVTDDLIKRCQKYGILIDRDEEGGLLQIFTKPMLDRPTLFVEIIQRLGCKKEDGTQKPACGGFGKGNFGALFKSIEDWEKIRDGEA
jgi:4-hydroxyphenylpyruvate dioxygenase